MTNLIVLAALLTTCILGACEQNIPTAPVAETTNSWTLTWSDEFNGAAGAGVNTADWIYTTGHGYSCAACPANWGTGEIETMSNSTANVFQDGTGNLVIKPIRAGSTAGSPWTSGRIETQRTDFQAATGGVVAFESRIQLPNVTGAAAQGYWAAFWVVGAPFRNTYTNWPSIGEIDILENVNGKNSWWGTLHCGIARGGPCNEPIGIGSGEVTGGWSPTLQAGYHVYRAEYDKSTSPEEIRWYVDGIQHWTVKATAIDTATWKNATNHGFFIIFNVAIGGGWPGNPTEQTRSGAPMFVDYVRVYNRSGLP